MDSHASLDEEVHCSICFELFEDPKLINNCFHTFCAGCIEPLIKDGKPCPICRGPMSAFDVKNDFKTKRLLEVHKNMNKPEPSAPPLLNLTRVHHRDTHAHAPKCALCDTRTSDVYCNACSRCLCSSCKTAHVKTTSCLNTNSVSIEQHQRDLTRTLDDQKRVITKEKTNFKQNRDNVIASTRNSTDACLRDIQHCEERDILQVTQLYKQLRAHVTSKRDDAISGANQRYTDFEKRADRMTAQILEIERASGAMIVTLQSLQQQINRELDEVRREPWKPLNMVMVNKDQPLMVDKNAPSVKVLSGNASTSLLYPGLQSSNVKENYVIKSRFYVSSLIKDLIDLKGRLVALMDGGSNDKLVELLPSGDCARVVCDSGLKDIGGVAVQGDDVIATSLTAGLLKVTADGKVSVIENGNYHHCCRAKDCKAVYAVKTPAKFGEPVSILLVQNGQISNRYTTEIKHSGSFLSIAVRDETLVYVCSRAKACMYEVALPNGRIAETYGRPGYGGPGELYEPKVCTQSNEDLVVADRNNNRIQLFNMAAKTWSILNIAQFPARELKKPWAVLANRTQLFVGGKSFSKLYFYVME